MSLQLLLSVRGLRERAVLAGPSIGDELGSAPQGPSSVELVEYVDEVVARGDAEEPTGLDERVSGCEALGGFRGCRAKLALAVRHPKRAW